MCKVNLHSAVAGIVIGVGLGIFALYRIGIFNGILGEPDRTIRGIVLDEQGASLPGVEVFAEEESAAHDITTTQGDFRISIGKPFTGDLVTLHVFKNGYSPARQQSTIPSSSVKVLLAKSNAGAAAVRAIPALHTRDLGGAAPQTVVVVGNGSPACTFYGQSSQGQPAWRKEDSCTIPRIDLLDAAYRQPAFVCCGGGATSPTTAATIPAGIELRASGDHDWAILNPVLHGDRFSVVTFCGPAAPPGPGCNVRVEVVPHYRPE